MFLRLIFIDINLIKATVGLILIFALVGCNNDSLISELETKLRGTSFNLKEYSSIIIMPNAGCATCIDNVEDFLLSSENQTEKTFIIFTAFSSKKNIAIRFGIEYLERPNVYLDGAHLFNTNNLTSLYPLFVYLKNDQVSNYEYASPDNAKALDNYIDFLTN
jgi:hypothetical protein